MILGEGIGERAMSYLDATNHDVRQTQQSFSRTYCSEFGHIRIPMDKNGLTGCQVSEFAEYSSTQDPTLTPSTIGLPLFLLSQLRDQRAVDVDVLKVTLIASPWRVQSENRFDQEAQLEMRFGIDRSSKLVRFEDITVVREVRKANLMLPGSTVDVQINRLDHRPLDGPLQDPAIAEYVKRVEQSAAGFGSIQAPQFLSLKQCPFDSASSDSGASQGAESQYFTSNVRVLQELHFEFHNFDLVYSRVGIGDAITSSQSLSLKMTEGDHEDVPEESGIETDHEDGPDTSLTPQMRAFLERTKLIVASLNRGAGDMSMMEVNPETAARLNRPIRHVFDHPQACKGNFSTVNLG